MGTFIPFERATGSTGIVFIERQLERGGEVQQADNAFGSVEDVENFEGGRCDEGE